MLTIFKTSKNTAKISNLTPKLAAAIAKKATIKPTSYEDILMDIELRADRGYTWTYMLQVDLDTIIKLENDGWRVKSINKNQFTNNFLVRISW